MKTRTAKSLLHISIIASIMALMASCTGWKSTTSYPVAQIMPERAGLTHQLNKSRHHKTNERFRFANASEDNRYDFQNRMKTQSDVQITLADKSKYGILNRNRPISFAENPGYYNILASPESKLDDKNSGNSYRALYKNQPNPGSLTNSKVNTGEDVKPAKERKDPKEMNGFGIVSLATGIASIILPYLAPVAVVFGAIGLNKRLRGLAIAGMVLGIVTILFYIAVIFLFLIALGGEGI